MRANSIDEYLQLAQVTFLPEKARDKHIVVQYIFSGRDCGACYITVDDSELHTAVGEHPTPTATVIVDFDLWLRIIAYEVDGLLAYQEGRYTATGDIEALMDADTWFKHL